MSEPVALKERIRQGEIIVGVSVPMNMERGRLEDILSRDTYSFISVDSQHSAYHEERLVSLCALAEAVGIPVQFRIKHPRHAYLIGNILDLGPLSIEVPLVETEVVVDEALAAFYIPKWASAVGAVMPATALKIVTTGESTPPGGTARVSSVCKLTGCEF